MFLIDNKYFCNEKMNKNNVIEHVVTTKTENIFNKLKRKEKLYYQKCV